MKKLIALTLAILVCLSVFAGCAAKEDTPATTEQPKTETPSNETASSEPAGDGKALVGIAMPTKEQPIWAAYGEQLQLALEKAGYEAILEYAEDDTSRQIMQLENMITKGAKYLVISSVDGYALTDVCEKASAAGVKVIAGDRLLMNTESVDYYVTFDLVRMGELQGEYIVKALGLDQGKGPFTFEMFSGSPDDPNSIPFYDGAMSVLQPYFDSGMLVCKSGQIELSVNGILKWDSAAAQSRMDNILSRYYSDGRLDSAIGAADCLSIGIISSLTSMGYGTEAQPFPVVVGQDCELTSVKYILEGKQAMSVFLNPVIFAEEVMGIIDTLEKGETPATDTTYNNNVIDVPTALFDPYVIDKDNVDYLIDVGFYTEADIYN